MKDGSSVLSAQKEKWGNGTLENPVQRRRKLWKLCSMVGKPFRKPLKAKIRYGKEAIRGR